MFSVIYHQLFRTRLFPIPRHFRTYRSSNLLKTVREVCQAIETLSRSPGGGGVLPEKFGRGVRPASQNRYPIYDQNLRFSLLYL